MVRISVITSEKWGGSNLGRSVSHWQSSPCTCQRMRERGALITTYNCISRAPAPFWPFQQFCDLRYSLCQREGQWQWKEALWRCKNKRLDTILQFRTKSMKWRTTPPVTVMLVVMVMVWCWEWFFKNVLLLSKKLYNTEADILLWLCSSVFMSLCSHPLSVSYSPSLLLFLSTQPPSEKQLVNPSIFPTIS